jgi:hypothetical protein
VSLPETRAGRSGRVYSGEGEQCVWLRPEAGTRFDFAEWTAADQLHRTKLAALLDGRDPQEVVKETRDRPPARCQAQAREPKTSSPEMAHRRWSGPGWNHHASE